MNQMEIVLLGLPQSGKTTLLNALTRGRTQAGSGAKQEVLAGVSKILDPRLDSLAAVGKPEKVTPAEITYWDVPAASGTLGEGAGIGGQFLNLLQNADALLIVVRAFSDPSVPHLSGTVDPLRDLESMEAELAFSDLAILERRVARIQDTLKGAKGHERDRLLKEEALLDRIKEELERDVPLREQQINEEGKGLIFNYQFLTDKPLLIVFNVDEGKLPDAPALQDEMARHNQRSGVRATALSAKLEMELSALSFEEEKEFRESLGVLESGGAKVGTLAYDAMSMVCYFTYGPTEARAWPVPVDIPAVKAAGKIHTDLERGFIRAEVVGLDDLIRCGSIAECKKQGVFRLEGKTYPVKDGDVITFLFNV